MWNWIYWIYPKVGIFYKTRLLRTMLKKGRGGFSCPIILFPYLSVCILISDYDSFWISKWKYRKKVMITYSYKALIFFLASTNFCTGSVVIHSCERGGSLAVVLNWIVNNVSTLFLCSCSSWVLRSAISLLFSPLLPPPGFESPCSLRKYGRICGLFI